MAIPAKRAAAAETLRAVERALSKAGEAFPETSVRVRDAAGRIRCAPSSVRRVGAIQAGSTIWVWCDSAPGASSTVDGQLVLDLPGGRYLCEVLDVDESRWCSRESAAGDPLVVGLPALAGQAVVRIGRIESSPGAMIPGTRRPWG
jgi:hypothetical protein